MKTLLFILLPVLGFCQPKDPAKDPDLRTDTVKIVPPRDPSPDPDLVYDSISVKKENEFEWLILYYKKERVAKFWKRWLTKP